MTPTPVFVATPTVSERVLEGLPLNPEVPPAEEDSPLAADERAYEVLAAEQHRDTFLEQQEDAQPSVVVASAVSGYSTSPVVAVPKDEVMLELEKILEANLGEHVASMPQDARVRFLYKGQETALAITTMIRSLKVQAKKVIELIRNWLLTIPGVNKFFLEQEAKIKTDQVLEFDKTYREQQQNQP